MLRLVLEGPLLTVNQAYKMHSLQRAKAVKYWRDQAWALGASKLRSWKEFHGTAQVPCQVQATPLTPGPCRQDTGAVMPTVKAVIDGLTDAGFWPDDTSEWVCGIKLLPQRRDRSLAGPAVEIWLRATGPITRL